MRVMVTGGAGYIGSVVVEALIDDGHDVVVYDNLSTGHARAVARGAVLIQADLRDGERLRQALRSGPIEAVIHMAADSRVGESVVRPDLYYNNNVVSGLSLLAAMAECEVTRLVFSSTAAVYGTPAIVPIDEDAPAEPENPYGATKLAIERALPWYGLAFGLRATSLRYFNAAGASARCGEAHDPETHLIPLVLQSAAGLRPPVTIHGDDYPTPDGTCIRDYIHVVDLARAHVLALTAIDTPGVRTYNLGCGGGHSVREVLVAARAVTGRDLLASVGPRRPGDPPVLIARSNRIQDALGWRPAHNALTEIVESAWAWMHDHPHGYR